MAKSEEELRDKIFAGKTLKENLRDVVAQGTTGYSYAELQHIVADPENEDMLDQEEVEQVDKTVNLLSHLFMYHTATVAAEADKKARIDENKYYLDLFKLNKKALKEPGATPVDITTVFKHRLATLTTTHSEEGEVR